MRAALWASVPLNVLGAALFGAAALGRPPALLPLLIPPFYAAQLALVIGLFAVVYFWLARRPVIDRAMVVVGAAGKLGFFALFVAYWLRGDLAVTAVVNATPDLVIGTIFVVWLGRSGS